MSCRRLPDRSMRWSKTIPPRVALSNPTMHFINVLLPLPLVPSSATVSPSRTSSDTPCNTRTAPYPASTLSIASLITEIDPLHLGVLHDLRRRAFGHEASGIQAYD